MTIDNIYVGWYAIDVEDDNGDRYHPHSESNGPHATREQADIHSEPGQVVRFLDEYGYLHLVEVGEDE